MVDGRLGLSLEFLEFLHVSFIHFLHVLVVDGVCLRQNGM
jgi:hypothetical protein